MPDDTIVQLRISRRDREALGLGHLDTLPLDLAEVEIGESVEIQRRLGLTPVALYSGLRPAQDAAAMLAGVWLALRQLGQPTAWGDIKIHIYEALAEADPQAEAAEGKGPAPETPEKG